MLLTVSATFGQNGRELIARRHTHPPHTAAERQPRPARGWIPLTVALPQRELHDTALNTIGH